ncbi:MAG: aminotransferase class V-fold PLP-dependent enzyme [candidate division Zixibacteria bacterium]|nr:aminotransferase class V-fold PLP-dependent enzyme [candidate division Zixibacteria bacterium]
MNDLLRQLSDEIEDYSENVAGIKLVPQVDLEEIKSYLSQNYSFETPIDLMELSADVSRVMRSWSLHAGHPNYFGLFVPGTKTASVIADALVALYNPQLGTWLHSPVSTEIERHTLKFLLKKFGYDPNSSWGNFTSGGTEANLSAMLTALTDRFPEYCDGGVRALKRRPLIYVSEEAHHSFIKIGQVTGLGHNAVRNVPSDENFRLDISELKRMVESDIREGLEPFMVVGTAGTTSAGVIDPLIDIAKFCRERSFWFHCDAAWGGAAVMSPQLAGALKGIEQSDSITCDAHKWFSVSMSAGMFFCRHPQAVSKTFQANAAYMPESQQGQVDSFKNTLQCSRRFIGLKLFMTLAELGEKGYAAMIEKQAELGEFLRLELIEKGFEILNQTPLPVVCFTHQALIETGLSTREVLSELYSKREFWISDTRLKNKIPALRACISSFRTNKEAVRKLVRALQLIVSKKASVNRI